MYYMRSLLTHPHIGREAQHLSKCNGACPRQSPPLSRNLFGMHLSQAIVAELLQSVPVISGRNFGWGRRRQHLINRSKGLCLSGLYDYLIEHRFVLNVTCLLGRSGLI